MAKKRIERKVPGRGSYVKLKGLEERIQKALSGQQKAEIPHFKGGDTIRVHVRIKEEGGKERTQAYEGVVIGRSGKGASRSFVVRKISHGVGVERIFLESSQRIAKIDVVQEGRVRRAKLYYLRELQGKAAKIEREVETQASLSQRESQKAKS